MQADQCSAAQRCRRRREGSDHIRFEQIYLKIKSRLLSYPIVQLCSAVLQTGGFRSHPVASCSPLLAQLTLFFPDHHPAGDFDDNDDDYDGDIDGDNEDDIDDMVWPLCSPLRLGELH